MLNEQSLLSLLSPWLEAQLEENQSHLLSQINVSNLELDSRKIASGDTFVAVVGHAVDGRRFITKAIEKGANAVVAQSCEQHPHGSLEMVSACPVIYLKDLNLHLSELSSKLYRSNTSIIGVTGTNGKTTISQLIAQWIELLDHRAAVMGTTGNGFLDDLQVAENTTGSAIEINRLLSDLADKGAEYAALEISSHGLVQGRVKSLPFSAGVFTNLSRDHLDYHGSMQAYADAKLMLFTEHQCDKAIVNTDDPIGLGWIKQVANAVAVSIEQKPEHPISLWATNVEYSEAGITLSFDGYWGEGEFTVPLIGKFNASNILLSLATLLSLGFDKQQLLACSEALTPVVGRMELFKAPGRAKIVVDYAHTPDALEKALEALRVHCSGHLWAIFGCGGDRDKGKRPMMAEIAERLADKIILTDDNPRSEHPDSIFNDMLTGLSDPQSAFAEHDRFLALEKASQLAGSDDIILLAGKGHEDYQVLDGQTIHYSDRESALTLLRTKG
jgi:UDP-N-acetylmuramoyl-L-alanyl-D-glutamate--2,6-diaminopimelate ligase